MKNTILLIVFILFSCELIPIKKDTMNRNTRDSTINLESDAAINLIYNNKIEPINPILNEVIIVKNKYFIKSGYKDPKNTHLKSYIKDKIKVNDHEQFGFGIRASNLKIEIGKVEIKQTNNAVKHKGSKAFSITTDANLLNDGNAVNLGSIEAKYAKASIYFQQNAKTWKIKEIVSDYALYNKDGTDSYFNSATFVKFDNKRSDSIDKRKGWIGKIKFTNSNQNLNLKKLDGSNASKFRAAVWFDEGFNNCDVDSVDVDLPFFISSNSKNHHFKYIRLRKKLRKKSSILQNAENDFLFIDTSTVQLRNMIIDTLKARQSLIYIDSLTKIDVIDFDSKTKMVKL